MKLKIATAVILLFFVIVISSVLAASYLEKNEKRDLTPTNQKTNTNTSKVLLTKELVSEHSTETDCWLIVSNEVYNATPLLESHSGGKAAMLEFCGRDATLAFQTKGTINREHSSTAYAILGENRLGTLGETIVLP